MERKSIFIFIILLISCCIMAEPSYKFGLVTGLGGLGDKAFNDMQFNGMIKAKKKYDISFDYIAPKDETEIFSSIDRMIDLGCDLIICGEGYLIADEISKIAVSNPNIHFVVLDNKLEGNYPPNLTSITFKQNEGSFLAGYLAANISKTGSIAMIGGNEMPVIKDFYTGFIGGAQLYDKDIKVYEKYISEFYNKNVWQNPQAALDISKDLIENYNVDVIYGVASASNLGIFRACKSKAVYAIGVDSNQDYLYPGVILTSMMKRLDNAILLIFDKFFENDLINKNYSLGLAENGVSLTDFEFAADIVTPVLQTKIDSIKNMIISDKIEIPTYFED